MKQNKMLAACCVGCLCLLTSIAFGDPPAGRPWRLIWGDEFNGTKVDDAKWEKVGDGPRRTALWLKSASRLDGKGNLVVTSSKQGDKYVCGGLRSKGRFMHSFGYYEIRCKVPDEVGTWAAFWLYAPSVGRVGNEGRDGTEIDIFEATWRDKDAINVALHWDGYGKAHRSSGGPVDAPGVNEGFHVFGLHWTPDEYIFYYDGKPIKRSKAGGVCQVPLYVKVTTEIGKWAGDITKAKLPDTFVVDYVRVYDSEAPLDMALEKLGWRVACQLYTFRDRDFASALDPIEKLGIKNLETCFFLPLDKNRPGLKTGESLPEAERKALKKKLDARGLRMACYYAPLGDDPAVYKKVFEYAKAMDVITLVAEPPAKMMDLAEKLCDEYKINLAIHNHPKGPNSPYWSPESVLAACKGRSRRIGACVDTGHWVRSGLKPVDCLKKLEGRILSVHLKDVNEWGNPAARDVPIGQGKADYTAVLKELHRQNFKGIMSIEYEHLSPRLMDDLKACVDFIGKTVKAILAKPE